MFGFGKGKHKTNPRLSPYEKAARIYCEKASMDPDQQIDVPHPTLQGVELQVPQWEFVAEQMIGLSMMLTSMKEAGEQMPKLNA